MGVIVVVACQVSMYKHFALLLCPSEARLFFGPIAAPTFRYFHIALSHLLRLTLSTVRGWETVNRSIMASKTSDGWLWVTLGQYLYRQPNI